jgi:hypothetical protein
VPGQRADLAWVSRDTTVRQGKGRNDRVVPWSDRRERHARAIGPCGKTVLRVSRSALTRSIDGAAHGQRSDAHVR